MKRFLSTFLCIVLIVAMASLVTGCEKGSEGLEYKSNNDGTCAVVGMGSCTDTELIIPSKSPDGDKVVEIGDNAFKDAEITSLKLSDNVTKIGSEAFYSCLDLATVDLGSSLVSIGYQAFAFCDALKEIELPDSFEEFALKVNDDGETELYSNAFSSCDSLKKINIPKNVKALYSDTFFGTPIEEVEIDAEFKYYYIDSRSFDEDEGFDFDICLFAEKPKEKIEYFDKADLVDVNEDIMNTLYLSAFKSKGLTLNGKQIKTEKPVLKEGFYGNEDNILGFEIVSNSKIIVSNYSFSNKKYEVELETTYKYDESINCYVMKDTDGSDVYITVFDKFFVLSENRTYYEFNVKYKK